MCIYIYTLYGSNEDGGFGPPKTVPKTVGFNRTQYRGDLTQHPNNLNEAINQSIALHPSARKYEGLQHNAKQQMLVPPLCAAATSAMTTTCYG